MATVERISSTFVRVGDVLINTDYLVGAKVVENEDGTYCLYAHVSGVGWICCKIAKNKVSIRNAFKNLCYLLQD